MGIRKPEPVVIHVCGRLGIVPAAVVIPKDEDRGVIPVFGLADCIDELRLPTADQCSNRSPGGREFAKVGVTQLIWRSFPFETSVKNCAWWGYDVVLPIGAIVDVFVGVKALHMPTECEEV